MCALFSAPSTHTHTQSSPVLDVCAVLNDSVRKRRTILTVPWVVEFLSMMDFVGPLLPCYRTALGTLLLLYRSDAILSQDGIRSLKSHVKMVFLLLEMSGQAVVWLEFSQNINKQPEKRFSSVTSFGFIFIFLVITISPCTLNSILISFTIFLALFSTNCTLETGSVSPAYIQKKTEETSFLGF